MLIATIAAIAPIINKTRITIRTMAQAGKTVAAAVVDNFVFGTDGSLRVMLGDRVWQLGLMKTGHVGLMPSHLASLLQGVAPAQVM